MRRILLFFSLLNLCLITETIHAISKTNKKACKKQISFSKNTPQKPKCSQKEYTRYLERKGIQGFKEAIKILKTAIPVHGTKLEKSAAARKISNLAITAQEDYLKQQKSNLNKFGINDKALTALIGVATAHKLAPFYISDRFTLQDLDAVERYITHGGKDEKQIQRLLKFA